MTTTTGEPVTHPQTHAQSTAHNEVAAADLAAAQKRQAAITAPEPGQSYCDIQPVRDGVRVRCRRVPLEPGIVLTHDQWAELHGTLVSGGLPAFAVELPNSWVTKIAPAGQEHHALFLWRDEIAALAQELRSGRHPQPAHTTDRSIAENAGRVRPLQRCGSSPPGGTTPTPRANDTRAGSDIPLAGEAGYQAAGRAVLKLSAAQVEILTAIDAFIRARIVDGVVQVGDRSHSMSDLYTLRAAKLVRPSRDGRGLRDRKRFEITERGTAEARRRLAHIGQPASQPAGLGSTANRTASPGGTDQ